MESNALFPHNVTLDDSKVVEDDWIFVEEIIEGASRESPSGMPDQEVSEKTSLQILFGDAERDVEEPEQPEQGSAGSFKTSSPEDSGNVSKKTSLQVLFDEMENGSRDEVSTYSDSPMKTNEGSPEVSRQISLQFPFDEDLQLLNETEDSPTASRESTVQVDERCDFEILFATPVKNSTAEASTNTPPRPTRPSAHDDLQTSVRPALSMRITRSQKRLRVAMELGIDASEKKPKIHLTRSQTTALTERCRRDLRRVNNARAQSHGKGKKRKNLTAEKHSGKGGRRGC